MAVIGCGNGAAPGTSETLENDRSRQMSMRWRKAMVTIAAVAGLGAAVQVLAHPGMGFGPGAFGPASKGAVMRGGFAGPAIGQQLMTTEEQQAFVEKMRAAKTPDERQKLAEANRAEMEKRAKDKGITLPQPHGPRAGFGPNFAPPFAAPNR